MTADARRAGSAAAPGARSEETVVETQTPESSEPWRALVVDDESQLRESLVDMLGGAGYTTASAADGPAALDLLRREQFDLLLTDLRMPDMDGVELVRLALATDANLVCIVITGYPDWLTAREALKAGASDYLVKPFSYDQVRVVVGRAIAESRLLRENEQLRRQLEARDRKEEPLGVAPRFREILDVAARVASKDVTVLLLGENGTGKDVFARFIHDHSPRASRPFVPISCAAIPEHLLESTLFGYEKGAFTDARTRHIGHFQRADRGTLLLDEIGELPLKMQSKLLRVLQDQCITPLGSTESKRVDVRILAATNRDLRKMVERGEFREDLYYRLNVVQIELPSLRQRREDIVLLARLFLERFAQQHHGRSLQLDAAVVDILQRYHWPGNIRQLRHLMEQLAVLGDGPVVRPTHLPGYVIDEAVVGDESLGSDPGFQARKQAEVDALEKRLLCSYLQQAEGIVSRAARHAQMQRTAFQRLMRKHGIQSESFR